MGTIFTHVPSSIDLHTTLERLYAVDCHGKLRVLRVYGTVEHQ